MVMGVCHVADNQLLIGGSLVILLSISLTSKVVAQRG
jgi:hypothetical protein